MPVYGYKKNKGKKEVYAKEDTKILWSNPNPTEAMGITNITLNSEDYDLYECIYKSNINNTPLASVKSIKGSGFHLTVNDGYSNKAASRGIYVNSATQLTIEKAYFSSTEEASEYCVPLYIIGYKTSLFE